MSRGENRLPEGWVEMSLGEMGSWTGGGTPSKSVDAYWNAGDVPWVSPKDMKRFVLEDTEDHITNAAILSSATNIVPKESVLVVTRSGILGRTLPVAITNVPVAMNQDMKALVPALQLHSRFIALQLVSCEQDILRQCRKSGTTVASIEFNELKSYELCVAPVNEQHRIVAKLDALQVHSDAAKAALDAVGPLLEKFRQSVLAAAFRGDLTRKWREEHPDVEPASVLLERIRAERRRKWEEANPRKKYVEPVEPDLSQGALSLPETWAVASVAEISECLDRIRRPVTRSERRSGPYPYFGANGQVDSVDDYLFDEDLVLVTEDETFYGRTKPIAYRVSGKCWVNNHAHVLRPVDAVPIDYLWQSLMHYHVEPWLSGTTGRAKLTQAAMNSLPIALAPAEEMEQIATKVAELLSTAGDMAKSAESCAGPLSAMNQSILAKAFRGELVPQDPNDEPASVLLERIRREREGVAVVAGKRGRPARSQV